MDREQALINAHISFNKNIQMSTHMYRQVTHKQIGAQAYTNKTFTRSH